MVSLSQTLISKIKKKYYPPLMFEYPIENIGGEMLIESVDTTGDDVIPDDSVGDPELSKGGNWFFNTNFRTFEEEETDETTDEVTDF